LSYNFIGFCGSLSKKDKAAASAENYKSKDGRKANGSGLTFTN
jgi:hypothetical protein